MLAEADAEDVVGADRHHGQHPAGAGRQEPRPAVEQRDQQGGRREAQGQGAAVAHSGRDGASQPGTQQQAHAAGCPEQAEGGRGEAELPDEQHRQHRVEDGAAQVVEGGVDGQRPQLRVAQYVAQPLPDPGQERRPGGRGRGFGGRDAGQAQCRGQVGGRGAGQGEGSGEGGDEGAARAATGDVGDGHEGDDGRIGADQAVAADQLGEHALRADVGEDGGAVVGEDDGVELREGEGFQPPGEGERGEQGSPGEVRGDQHPAGAQPVDPGAGRQSDEQEGGGGQCGEGADLGGAGVEGGEGEEGDGDVAGVGGELVERGGAEEGAEVLVEPGRGRRGRGGGRLLPDCGDGWHVHNRDRRRSQRTN